MFTSQQPAQKSNYFSTPRKQLIPGEVPVDQNPRQLTGLVWQHPVALGRQGRPRGVRESFARQPPHQYRR